MTADFGAQILSFITPVWQMFNIARSPDLQLAVGTFLLKDDMDPCVQDNPTRQVKISWGASLLGNQKICCQVGHVFPPRLATVVSRAISVPIQGHYGASHLLGTLFDCFEFEA